MTKTYIKPETTVYQININSQLLSGSPGPNPDDSLGDEFTSTDETYAKGFSFFGEEELEEE